VQATSGVDNAPVRRPKDRKAQIALAAAELFCARGFHGVGVDEIAAAVGIRGPAVYRHFPNKYAILVHATRELADSLLAVTADPAGETHEEVLDGLLGAVARVAVQRRKATGLYQWEARYLSDEHRREFGADLAKLVDRLAVPLRKLRPELRAGEARVLVRAALSVFGSLSTHRATSHRGTEELVTRVAWALLRATAPRPARSRRDSGGDGGGDVARLGLGSRREILLAEAIRLFHRHGYHAVGMEEIGRAANINASSVYRYFTNKGELLAAAYYRASDRLASAAATAFGGADDPADALRRLVESYVDYAFGQSDLVAVYLAENNNLPEADRHELRKTQRVHVEEWVRLVGMVRPELPANDARVLVHAALSLITDIGRLGHYDRALGYDQQTARLALTVLSA
jgi:AcrR family transcriptional regulator